MQSQDTESSRVMTSIESRMSSLTVSPWVMRPSFSNPKIPNQIILPYPMHTPDTKGHFFIFGIAVPEPQLLAYYGGVEYRRRSRNNTVDMNATESFRLLSVTKMLRAMINFHVSLDLCFPKGMGPTYEASQNTVVVVTLCSSNRGSYMHRPTKDQVDKLETFLACGPPDWYLDTKTTDFY